MGNTDEFDKTSVIIPIISQARSLEDCTIVLQYSTSVGQRIEAGRARIKTQLLATHQ